MLLLAPTVRTSIAPRASFPSETSVATSVSSAVPSALPAVASRLSSSSLAAVDPAGDALRTAHLRRPRQRGRRARRVRGGLNS